MFKTSIKKLLLCLVICMFINFICCINNLFFLFAGDEEKMISSREEKVTYGNEWAFEVLKRQDEKRNRLIRAKELAMEFQLFFLKQNKDKDKDKYLIKMEKVNGKFNKKAWRVSIIDKNKSKKSTFPNNFFFEIGIDQKNVVEITQTPLTLAQTINPEVIKFQKMLFNIAQKKVDLKPNIVKENGGGHIHIGLDEAFKKNPFGSLCFVAELYSHPNFLLCGLKGIVKHECYVANREEVNSILTVIDECLKEVNQDTYKKPEKLIARSSEERNCFEKLLDLSVFNDNLLNMAFEDNELGPIGTKMKKDNRGRYIVPSKNMSINLAGAAGYTKIPTIEIRSIAPQEDPIKSLAQQAFFQTAINYANKTCDNLLNTQEYIKKLYWQNRKDGREEKSDIFSKLGDRQMCSEKQFEMAAKDAVELVDKFKTPSVIVMKALHLETSKKYQKIKAQWPLLKEAKGKDKGVCEIQEDIVIDNLSKEIKDIVELIKNKEELNLEGLEIEKEIVQTIQDVGSRLKPLSKIYRLKKEIDELESLKKK
ncbi:MAG: hypothetical protein HQK49_15695 [Oligoflexia bacterium]|nr:hypothetical protein [Oligoflexia bacterium]